ncbi:MAG TPA: tetratricopeptide repeat protein [Terriglobia bacterium]|nr:tetratricopeptide repeat protein [Terriglobia bacterium]
MGLLLAANSAYVAAFSSPNIFSVANDLAHPFLGLLVGVLLIAFVVRHRAYFATKTAAVALTLLAIAAGFGVYLAIAGMTRPHSLELYIHVGCAMGGLFFLLVHLTLRVAQAWNREQEAEISGASETEGASAAGMAGLTPAAALEPPGLAPATKVEPGTASAAPTAAAAMGVEPGAASVTPASDPARAFVRPGDGNPEFEIRDSKFASRSASIQDSIPNAEGIPHAKAASSAGATPNAETASSFGATGAGGGRSKFELEISKAEARLAKADFEIAESEAQFAGRQRRHANEGPPELEAGTWQLQTRAWKWCAAVMFGSLTFYLAAAGYQHYFPNSEYIIGNPSTPPLTMDQEGGGASSLMFPSSAQTSDDRPILSTFFMNSESCRRCHQDIYDQWQSSMHHFASFNNQWYRKAVEYMQDTIGIKPSLWCGGCHDHALSIAGKMQRFPIREIENTPAGQNGLGCMSCHAIVHVDSTMGQGGITFEYPKLAELAESKNPFLRFLHDYDVRLDPKPHREAFLKPFHKDRGQTPKFCSACHKVHLDVPVNHYRWIRGFDDYDNWQASGVSGLGARSFYYPPKPEECEDCHMPLVPSKDFGNINGYVHSHRFAAANTAVPTSHGDEAQVADVEKFLKDAVTVDIFGLAQEPAETSRAIPSAASAGPQLASTFAVGEESAEGLTSPLAISAPPARLEAPLGRADAALHPGETARVEVVVRTRKVGHFFPGGTVDAFDCWVELQARDSKGRIIFWSGEVADNGKGPVDPGAHFYKSLQLDEHGNVINKRNAWSTHAVVYAHLIPPGAADTIHYRLKVPRDVGDHITFIAKLNYRKFSWWNTQWAFAGVRDPSNPYPNVTKDYDDGQWVFTGSTAGDSESIKGIPNVPIVVMSEDTKTVPVAPASKREPEFQEAVTLNPHDWERWNDYGIGLLLQGDLKGAERAFKIVTQERPGYADGWVNVARALIQEGNIEAAKPMLAKAMEVNPSLASAHYFDGLALKTDGDYPDAYHQFSLAAARYPSDRVNRNQMGRMLFLQRKYSQAVAEYDRTLSIDPEDLEAHYNLMLCYRGLNEDALASREEKLYLRFKANESAQAITGPFKLDHPDDNNEAQPIHEHVSVALNQRAGRKQYAESRRPRPAVHVNTAAAKGLGSSAGRHGPHVSETACVAGGPASK